MYSQQKKRILNKQNHQKNLKQFHTKILILRHIKNTLIVCELYLH